MKELIEALGPWPMIQGIVIGLIVAGVGVWAILKGMRGDGDKDKEPDLEEMKAKWKFFDQFDDVHTNSFALIEQLKQQNSLMTQILAVLNRIADNRWNSRQ
jgi:hypothetical protein